MSKSNYSESVKKLRAFLKEKETYRQDWANEKWMHTDGRFFGIGRFLIPILTVIGAIFMVMVCIIRFVNIPEIGRLIVGNAYGLNSTAKDDPSIYKFFALVFIAICLSIYIAIRFIKGKYQKSPYLLFGTSLFLSVCALLRYFADQNTFPDNSNYDGAPTFTYFEYCLFTLAVFAAITIYAVLLSIIAIRDKREFDRNVEYILLKIIPNKKSGDLLTEDEYARLIEEYIEIETVKENLGKLPKKEAKKRKKELEEKKNKTEE